MMDQFSLSEQDLNRLAKAITRELLRELTQATAVQVFCEAVRRQGVFQVGSLRVDTLCHEAFLGGQSLPLKPREFALLACFIRNPGRSFTRRQLLELVWPEAIAGAIESDRTVDVHVRRIRAKLGEAGAHLIQTIHGVGYKLQSVGEQAAEPVNT